MTGFDPRRSVLFTPGDNERRMLKALTLGADTVCFDLEDAVAPENKAAARDLVKQVLLGSPAPDGARAERCVRINALDTDLWRHDLAVALEGKPDAIMVPKAEDPLAVIRFIQELGQEEARLAIPAGHTKVLLIIETALGVLKARECGAECGSRLGALLFGAEDLAADAGLVRSPDSIEVLVPRSLVGLAAASLKVGCLDQVFTNFQDPEGLEKEARFARTLGYTGKMAIHPDQLAPIHKAFTPSVDEVKRAMALLKEAQNHGGVFRFEGRMIDQPLVTQAERVVRVAQRAGMLVPKGG